MAPGRGEQRRGEEKCSGWMERPLGRSGVKQFRSTGRRNGEGWGRDTGRGQLPGAHAQPLDLVPGVARQCCAQLSLRKVVLTRAGWRAERRETCRRPWDRRRLCMSRDRGGGGTGRVAVAAGMWTLGVCKAGQMPSPGKWEGREGAGHEDEASVH